MPVLTPKERKERRRLESSIQRSILDYAKELGWRPHKRTSLAAMGRTGDPDLEFNGRDAHGHGYTFFMEVKRWGEESTPLQAQRQKELSELGFHVYVDVDSVAYGKAILDEETTFRDTP